MGKMLMSWVAYPLGWIMWLLYSVIPNYGLVILGFTIIMKILLFPATLKQHKSSISTVRLRPKMEEIKNRYAQNPQKYQEEMMKLYQEEGVNPASGCLMPLLQFPILFGMMGVVYAPLKYILRLSDTVISNATLITKNLLHTDILAKGARGEQYVIINTIKNNPKAFQSLGQDVIDKVLSLKFNFLGMDLSKTPIVPHSFADLDWLLLIPILSGLTALWLSVQTMRNSSNIAVDEASMQAAQSSKFMFLIMPIFSIMISFSCPAGVGLYWIFSNLFAILQTSFLYKRYNPIEIAQKAQEEMIIQREQERLARIEARKQMNNNKNNLDKNGIYDGMSQKEINKVKLANARKRDAEKYGDYNE